MAEPPQWTIYRAQPAESVDHAIARVRRPPLSEGGPFLLRHNDALIPVIPGTPVEDVIEAARALREAAQGTRPVLMPRMQQGVCERCKNTGKIEMADPNKGRVDEGGETFVVDVTELEHVQCPDCEGASPTWLAGYRAGVADMRDAARKAVETAGFEETDG